VLLSGCHHHSGVPSISNQRPGLAGNPTPSPPELVKAAQTLAGPLDVTTSRHRCPEVLSPLSGRTSLALHTAPSLVERTGRITPPWPAGVAACDQSAKAPPSSPISNLGTYISDSRPALHLLGCERCSWHDLSILWIDYPLHLDMPWLECYYFGSINFIRARPITVA
jgi:hypothetical protein